METVTRTEYDNLGQILRTIENYTDGVVTSESNKTVEYTYLAPGLMKTLTAKVIGGGGQTTEWLYGVSTGSGSGLNSNEIVGEVRHPDPSTGESSASEAETMTVNALGQTLTSEDRNGNIHAFDERLVIGRPITLLASALAGHR